MVNFRKELINDVNMAIQETKLLYYAHDNEDLFNRSKNAYNLVSIIRKYLVVKSLEGEFAKHQNNSTLKRLYISSAKLQVSVELQLLLKRKPSH